MKLNEKFIKLPSTISKNSDWFSNKVCDYYVKRGKPKRAEKLSDIVFFATIPLITTGFLASLPLAAIAVTPKFIKVTWISMKIGVEIVMMELMDEDI